MMKRGGIRGSPGLPVQSPVREPDPGRDRESATVLLSAATSAVVTHKRQRDVNL